MKKRFAVRIGSLRIFRQYHEGMLAFRSEFLEPGQEVELEEVERSMIYDHSDHRALRGEDDVGEYYILVQQAVGRLDPLPIPLDQVVLTPEEEKKLDPEFVDQVIKHAVRSVERG